MLAAKVRPIREGFHTVTPYLIVQQAEELIGFVKQAFGAEELLRGTGSAGGIHCEVRITDSILMIGGGGVWRGTPMPAAMHLYVRDADAAYRRALEAGASAIYDPIDQEYGDREAGVKDLAGNLWFLATHRATGHAPPGLRTVTPYLLARGASELSRFLQQALGAEETERASAADGTVLHAKLKVGDSIVELGEARGAFQPLPCSLYLYVPDADTWYQRAVQAGATSLMEPADQPFGDRMGGIRDPAGNHWYFATHIRDLPPSP